MVPIGFLASIEDPITGAPLYAFVPNNLAQTVSLKRRSGTYTVLGADYGVDPFGIFPSPAEVRPFVYGFRVVLDGGSLDGARDALWGAVGGGKQQRLVWQGDRGYQAVVLAKCVGIEEQTTPDSTFRQDFVVTWELLRLWQDRTARNVVVFGGGHKYGDGGLLWGANSTLLTGTSQTINLVADGSDGLRKPTADDTTPRILVTGPYGGDVTTAPNGAYSGGGWTLTNTTYPGAYVPDFGNAYQTTSFQVFDKLGVFDQYIIDPAARTVTKNGVPMWSRFKAPDWQRLWMLVVAGAVNPLAIAAVGANPVYRASAVQPVLIAGAPTGGTFTLSPTIGGVTQTTAAIQRNDSAATVQTRLAALSIVGAGNVLCTGGPLPSPVYIGFTGTLSGKTIPLIQHTDSFTGGTSPVAAIPLFNTWMIGVTGAPTGGTVTITVTNNGTAATTTAIPFNASFAAVYNAVAALPNVGPAIGVTGGNGPNAPWYLNLSNVLQAGATVTATSALTGGTSPAVFALPHSVGGTGSVTINWYGKYF